MPGVILWDDPGGLMLSVSIALVLVLLWYISTQDYRKACDRRIANMYYQAQMNAVKDSRAVADVMEDIGSDGLGMNNIMSSMVNDDAGASLSSPPDEKTMLEKHRINVFNPEKRVMDFIEQGDALTDKLNIKKEYLTLDELPIKGYEMPDDMMKRSFTTADYNGPQLEGMSAPIDQFERAAMIRQNQQKEDIYGAASVGLSNADTLSSSNF